MVGFTGALIGSAVIGAGAGLIGSSKQSKAAKQAANISSADNAANRALQESIYNRNVSFLSPTMQRGEVASNAIMELLGLPRAQASAFSGYGAPLTGMVTTTPNGRSAFDTYRGSTGYDFRVSEGNRALQSAFSRNLESGAASKAAIRFGQGIASDEFGRYMDMLRGVSQQGFGAGSALAGVGQNFANTVTAGNTAAANAQANARLYAGNVAANNWANLGSSFGNVLGWLGK